MNDEMFVGLTRLGLARRMIWVNAWAGRIGLYAGKSWPDAGCKRTRTFFGEREKETMMSFPRGNVDLLWRLSLDIESCWPICSCWCSSRSEREEWDRHEENLERSVTHIEHPSVSSTSTESTGFDSTDESIREQSLERNIPLQSTSIIRSTEFYPSLTDSIETN